VTVSRDCSLFIVKNAAHLDRLPQSEPVIMHRLEQIDEHYENRLKVDAPQLIVQFCRPQLPFIAGLLSSADE
jgi:hypothetical protein